MPRSSHPVAMRFLLSIGDKVVRDDHHLRVRPPVLEGCVVLPATIGTLLLTLGAHWILGVSWTIVVFAVAGVLFLSTFWWRIAARRQRLGRWDLVIDRMRGTVAVCRGRRARRVTMHFDQIAHLHVSHCHNGRFFDYQFHGNPHAVTQADEDLETPREAAWIDSWKSDVSPVMVAEWIGCTWSEDFDHN